MGVIGRALGTGMCKGMQHLELPPVADSVTAARRFVGELGLPEPPQQDAELLVSEVVTNAIRHANLSAEDRISLFAERNGDLRVEVCHPGPSFERQTPAKRGEHLVGGWGLRLVEALAHQWGVRDIENETCVWFSMPVDAARE